MLGRMSLRGTSMTVAALVGLVLTLLFASTPSASAAIVPAGFDDQQVAVVAVPTSVAFGPGTRMLITSKTGALRVYRNGTLSTTPAIDLSPVACSNSERGLLGVAFDPAFATNGFIYLYYTYNKFGTCDMSGTNTPVNRVSRFVLGENNIVDPASEMVLIDNIPSPSGIHNAGDLNFGKDGNLYVSVGEGGCDWRGDSGCGLLNNAARDLGGLSGKILRITRDGAIPAGNPYTGTNTDRCNVSGSTMLGNKCQEIYAWGLRNPFRMGFDVNSPTTRFHINDVGEAKWDEIDVGEAGADYGWNVREGHCATDSATDCGPQPVGMTNPIYDYDHSSCSAITAGDFVPAGIWPSEYDGAYLYGDVVCGKMFRLDPNGSGGFTATEFASDMYPLIDGVFGPYGTGQALYYVTWQGAYPNGQVRRISYTAGANRAPTARADATPTAGALPLEVTFDGTASTDPDGDPLSYEWDFGDGSPIANGSTLSHTYTSDGTYTATLTVRDPEGEQSSATERIDAGNNVPVPSIDVPVTSQHFKVGEQIVLHGSATDPEDGALPDSALTWRVERHHNTHTHPYLPATSGNDVPISGPQPEDRWAAETSYLEVFLTATDSEGRSSTVTRDIDPKKVDLSFATVPAGFDLEVAGSPITAPLTVTSWEDWSFPISAPNQEDDDEVPWRFQAWSDGGAQEHTIVTGANPVTYTAIMKRVDYPRPGGATPLRVPLVPAFSACTNPNTVHVVPLFYESCTPPVLESPLLTTSVVGAGSGSVRLSVIVGNPSTSADEADVSISGSATDVRRKSDGGDYAGSVLLSTLMRITDKGSGSSGLVPGTVSDIRFAVPVNCVATASTSTGGSCTLGTTLDTLLPGMAREGKRTILSTFAFELDDAGPDGSILPPSGTCPPTCGTGDESVFLRQGVFTP